MYYSTPGALKVQGLAARKVTTGSPLNSCKLLAGFGEAGWRGGKGMEHGFGRVAYTRVFFHKSPSHPPSLERILFLDAGSTTGHRLYSYMAWPL